MSRALRWLLVGLYACGGGDAVRDAAAKGPPAEAPTAATPAAAPSCGAAMPDVVAEVGGAKITSAELFDAAAPALVAAEVALADARRDALDEMIMQRLLEAEGKKQGVEVDAMVQGVIAANAKAASDAEVTAFYEQNAMQMQGMPLEEVRPQVEKYLFEKAASDAIRGLVDRLRAESGVKTFLEPYRVTVDAGVAARKGSPQAPIQIVEFSDFQCPYCSMAAETVRQVEARYGDRVSVVYRHFPLPFHGAAKRAAEAAECANDQGQFWKFHDALFADQRSWSDADYARYAKDLGLDGRRFEKCLDDGTHTARIDGDIAAGKRAGMDGTPGFYVNGVVLTGAQPLEAFVAVIDAELARRGG